MRGGEDRGNEDVFGNRSLDEAESMGKSDKQELCKK